MNKIAEIIGTPKFNIGDFIIHRGEVTEVDDSVVQFMLRGLIVGFIYCGDDNSTDIGWHYTSLVYEETYYDPDKTNTTKLLPLLVRLDWVEHEIELDLNPCLEITELIKNREKQVIEKFQHDLERENIRLSK